LGGVYDPLRLADTPLKPQRFPGSLLINHIGVLEATNEPARDVFMRVLRSIDDRATWLLIASFDPNYQNYWVGARAHFPDNGSDSIAIDRDVDRSQAQPGFLLPEEVERIERLQQQ
jgi:hypothetical protein